MVKHGLLAAMDLGRHGEEPGQFKTTIDRNAGFEFDLPLLETENAQVKFDLTTRGTYAPWRKKDEITFDVVVRCKKCREKGRYQHGRSGWENGTDLELFKCNCGACFVQLVFQFRPNSTFDSVDWVPMLGPVVRTAGAVASYAVGDTQGAREHLEAAEDLFARWVHLDKDDAVTKIAELIPVTNLFAALALEYGGQHAEAVKALDIIQSWRGIGSPDGALARLMELFPGTDVVAFALHLNAGSFAQALRAITNAEGVSVRLESLTMVLRVAGAEDVECLDIEGTGLHVGPSHGFVTGAIIDFVADLLNVRSSDEAVVSGSTPVSPGHVAEKQLVRLAGSARDSVSDSLLAGFDALEDMMPALIEALIRKGDAYLQELSHHLSLWVLWLVPGSMRRPSNVLLTETLQLAVRSLRITHYDSLPDIKPLLLPTTDLHGVLHWRVVFVGSFVFGFLLLERRIWSFLILAVAVGFVASTYPLSRLERLSREAASKWTSANEKMWRSVAACGGSEERCSLRSFHPVMLLHFFCVSEGLLGFRVFPASRRNPQEIHPQNEATHASTVGAGEAASRPPRRVFLVAAASLLWVDVLVAPFTGQVRT
eukprot:TRINITY_DN14787_c1_g1_i4.p1 TRINITY_DN14787_c1_g1~~TRINITY_DN14787_c1_g1_i4.p1  ORF type:complete len:597 (+),score=68.96 TRINITY_DN14787_c1_g1_i4:159-1949(+)